MSRAQSAKDFIVRSRSEKHLKWEASVDATRSERDLAVHVNLANGIENSLKLQKRMRTFRRKRNSEMLEKLDEKTERHKN